MGGGGTFMFGIHEVPGDIWLRYPSPPVWGIGGCILASMKGGGGARFHMFCNKLSFVGGTLDIFNYGT